MYGYFEKKYQLKTRNFLRSLIFLLSFPFRILLALVPRNNNIWIFGNAKFYGDNTKYLYLHIKKYHPEIKAVWLTKNWERLKSNNEYFHAMSLRGLYYGLRAKVGVVANGMGDINRFTTSGMKIIYVDHGILIKKIGIDHDEQWIITKNIFFRFLNSLSLIILKHNNKKYNLFTITSKKLKPYIQSAFNTPLKNILVTGSARSDIILGGKYNRFNTKEKKVILYAPTWRDAGWPEISGKQFDNNKWNYILQKNNYIFYLKLHPLTLNVIEEKWGIIPSDNIKYLVSDRYTDINYLLPEVDILVSDFSSVITDFSLLERPILFFTPDLDNYSAKHGFYFEYDEITDGLECTAWEELLEALKLSMKNNDTEIPYVKNAKRIKNLFHKFDDTNNCERIYQAIASISR